MMKKIVYIGNNLKNKNPTTLIQLSKLLEELDYKVCVYSNKQHKLIRMLHMCFGVMKHRNANYLLIDTYSTTNFYYALIVSQLARLFSIKYIPIIHGGDLPKRLVENPKSSNLIFSNSFINVSPSNYLQEIFLKYNFKTIFIPNSININEYIFTEGKELIPKLLWVRAFQDIYNPNMAIEVLEIILKKYSKATLCMVGPDKDGSLKEILEYAKAKNILNSIEITGFLSKSDWIKKSKEYSIFINTTNYDNSPVSVVEAMALGLPVVSTNVGGMPYLIESFENGILVNKNDADEMATYCIQLIENPVLAAKISRNARTKVEKFDSEIVKEQWSKLLNI
jgi:glycosyltransferase involved in cell wall biosynthesis